MDFVGVGWRATAEYGSAVEAVPPAAEVKVLASSLCIVQLGYPFLPEHTDVCCIRLSLSILSSKISSLCAISFSGTGFVTAPNGENF